MIHSQEIIEHLGYDKAPTWIENNGSASDDHSVSGVARLKSIRGVYTIKTTPNTAEGDNSILQKIVYVAEAKNLQEARNIHKGLWNTGDAPFLIVILPDQVRVYSCFSFDSNLDSTLVTVNLKDNISVISEALESFRADSIDHGHVWGIWKKEIKADDRIDRHMLTNLRELGRKLTADHNLDASIAHSLIGKYIYIRYLLDRGIISNEWLLEQEIDISRVLGRDADVKTLVKLTDSLQKRFSGKIFPIDFNRLNAPSDRAVAFVASVFLGDLPSGQVSFGFDIYDFSFIPIEMLSSIYEQFLEIENLTSSSGAFYTPRPLADFLISQVNAEKSIESGSKILDPSCGSGVFLVLAYRFLIERKIKEVGRRLEPSELKGILEDSIYGVERNIEACHVTEFSLILMLLSYLDPPDLYKNSDFRFPILHNNHIFQSDFFDMKSHFQRSGLKFDFIVGNPPWIEINPKKDTLNATAVSWINDNKKAMPVARYRTSEAFMWGVRPYLKNDGVIGLLVQATSLTNQSSLEFRRSFFRNNKILRVTNFSNLAYILFGGRAQETTALIVFRPILPDTNELQKESSSILHYGPFVANQLPVRDQESKQSWTITISEGEMSYIEHSQIESGDILPWKFALWGNSRDALVLRELSSICNISLSHLIELRGWKIAQGLQLRDNAAGSDPVMYHESLENIQIVDIGELKKSKRLYTVPENVIYTNTRKFLRKGRIAGLSTHKAPHIILNFNSANYSEIDFVLPHPNVCVSAPSEDSDYLKALSVYLNSSLAKYISFFNSPTWGSSRTVFNKADADNISIPSLTSKQISDLADLYHEIAAREENFFSPLHDSEYTDNRLAAIIGIPNHIAVIIEEFFKIRINYNKGKVHSSAKRRVSQGDLKIYGVLLKQELELFSGQPHHISFSISQDFVACSIIALDNESTSNHSPEIYSRNNSDLEELWKNLNIRSNQWMYIQKSLKIFSGSIFHLVKPNRLISWTRTNALVDSDEVITEIIRQIHLSEGLEA